MKYCMWISICRCSINYAVNIFVRSPQLLTVTLDVARKDELEHQLAVRFLLSRLRQIFRLLPAEEIGILKQDFKVGNLSFNLFPLIPACTGRPGLPLLPASSARPGLPLSAPANGFDDERHRQSPSHHSFESVIYT